MLSNMSAAVQVQDRLSKLGRRQVFLTVTDPKTGIRHEVDIKLVKVLEERIEFSDPMTKEALQIPLSQKDCEAIRAARPENTLKRVDQNRNPPPLRLVPTSTAAKRISALNSGLYPASPLRGQIRTYSHRDKANIPPPAPLASVSLTPKKVRTMDPSEVEVESDDAEFENQSDSHESKKTTPVRYPVMAALRANASSMTTPPSSSLTNNRKVGNLTEVFNSEDAIQETTNKLNTPKDFSKVATKGLSSSYSSPPLSRAGMGPTFRMNSLTKPAAMSDGRPFPRIEFQVNSNSSTSSPREAIQLRRRGYPNPGFVCYCNAVIQALVTCDKFEKEMLSDFWDEVLQARNASFSQTPVFNGLRKCFLAAKQREMANPSATIRQYLDDRFANTKVQHDAHEFLLAVFDKINIELSGNDVGNRENQGLFLSQIRNRIASRFPLVDSDACSKSKVLPTTRVFEATTEKSIECHSCHDLRKGTPETFLVHSLDFLSSTEAEDSIELEDMLVGNFLDDSLQQVKCEKCSEGTQANVRNYFTRIPRVLIFHLKRFRTFEGSTGKRQDRVKIPKVLSLGRVMSSEMDDSMELPITPLPSLDALKNASYELIAGVFHSGRSASSGHYTTLARDLEASKEQWIMFDDLSVHPYNQNWIVLEHLQRDGYLYFYRLVE